MPGILPIAVAFFHKRNDTRTQLHRMRLAHGFSFPGQSESPPHQESRIWMDATRFNHRAQLDEAPAPILGTYSGAAPRLLGPSTGMRNSWQNARNLVTILTPPRG
jgi:hypothetical protein